jgi:CubicO group peptidase (beta-lactamase class C family)
MISSFAEIDRTYEAKVAAGAISGIVYAVARGGQVVHAKAIGWSDIASRTPMALDSVFRLMSMTKPITAVALMMLYDEGRFQLDDPLTEYLPEFAAMTVLRHEDAGADDVVPAERGITVRDVLRHTTGYGVGFGMGASHEKLLAEKVMYVDGENLADQMAKIATVPLGAQPGAVWNYSLSPDIQARLVEVLSGVDFASFVQTRILVPLGMTDTGYSLSPEMAARRPSLYWMGAEGLVHWTEQSLPPALPGIAWPEPLVRLDDPSAAYERGAFGLQSTVGNYLKFAQMLLNGGEADGVRYLSEATVKLMATDHLGDIPMPWKVEGLGFGLGFAVIKDATQMGFAGTDGTFYWDGAAGTIFWIDPARDLIVVALAQHLFVPGMDPQSLNAEMHNLVYAALSE